MSHAGSSVCTPSATKCVDAGAIKAGDSHLNPLWAFGLLLFAGGLLGMSPILVRFSGVSADASAFWRVALAAPLLCATAFLVPARPARPDPASPTSVGKAVIAGWMVLAGVFFAADLIACHVAIELTTAGNAILLANLAPVIIGLLGLVGLARRPGRMFWFGLPFAGFGAWCLFRASDAGTGSMAGDAFGLLAAVFYAGYLIVIGRLRRHIGAAVTMSGTTVVTAIVIGVFAAIKGDLVAPTDMTGWLALAALGILVHALGQGMVSVGLKSVDEATGSMVLLVQPFVATLLGALVLGEVLNGWHMLGNIAVVFALLIATRARRRPA
ncbi:DMT family transporter [Thalassospira profundimaris]|uniref:DMT family transporter n=1 Tax=Thalassospira profundimaris TaxID=502049 RepID=UPI000DED3988|nr:EamA family transporter [Thalassospira profundimaris]